MSTSAEISQLIMDRSSSSLNAPSPSFIWSLKLLDAFYVSQTKRLGLSESNVLISSSYRRWLINQLDEVFEAEHFDICMRNYIQSGVIESQSRFVRPNSAVYSFLIFFHFCIQVEFLSYYQYPSWQKLRQCYFDVKTMMMKIEESGLSSSKIRVYALVRNQQPQLSPKAILRFVQFLLSPANH
jgi:hypothetical protein